MDDIDHGDDAAARANADPAKKGKPYWILAERMNGQWGVAYGSYEKKDVSDEYEDYLSNTQPRANLKVIRLESDDQATIDAAIAKLNGVAPAAEPPAAEPSVEDDDPDYALDPDSAEADFDPDRL